MTMGLLFRISVGAGAWSIDAWFSGRTRGATIATLCCPRLSWHRQEIVAVTVEETGHRVSPCAVSNQFSPKSGSQQDVPTDGIGLALRSLGSSNFKQ